LRECGDCTACCEGWVPDDDLDMRPGKPCAHCRSGGCAIYDSRPEDPCRVFQCAWLQDEEAFPDELRPDKSGAIILSARYWKEWNVLRATPVGASVPQATLEWLRLYTESRELPLIFYERECIDGVYTQRGRQLAYGPPDFSAAMQEMVMRFGHAQESVITSDDIVKF
jgi:hypothetical protein